jgi:hypothetical protein
MQQRAPDLLRKSWREEMKRERNVRYNVPRRSRYRSATGSSFNPSTPYPLVERRTMIEAT